MYESEYYIISSYFNVSPDLVYLVNLTHPVQTNSNFRFFGKKEVSWFQQTPETSLDFFKQFKVPRTAKVIDIGGGGSFLVDHLLNLGYQDFSVDCIPIRAVGRANRHSGTDHSVTLCYTLSNTVKPFHHSTKLITFNGSIEKWHHSTIIHLTI